MSLDNLDAPLRITWDICPAGHVGLADAELLQVSERLLEAGIFYLLLDEQPLLHPGLPALLNMMSARCQVSIVLGDDPLERQRLENLEHRCSLFVDAAYWIDTSLDLDGLESCLERLVTAGHNPSLLWVPAAGRLHNLFPLLELCERRNIPRFKLPNHKITANSDPAEKAGLLCPDDLAILAETLKQRPLKTGKTTLEVHDLFLWELIFPQGGGERSEYGGCQAANSLGHIAANADLWPCSSWPQALGNLLEHDLHSIWDCTTRHQVRAEVASEPEDCAGCRDYQICFAGCRGLARTYRQDGRRDLLCCGPRE
jgi:GeoRSP system SPASM domain protein